MKLIELKELKSIKEFIDIKTGIIYESSMIQLMTTSVDKNDKDDYEYSKDDLKYFYYIKFDNGLHVEEQSDFWFEQLSEEDNDLIRSYYIQFDGLI